MVAQLDLIIPPVIVGLLIILIFRVNAFMMDSSVDTRLSNDVQMHADLIADIIQEELRGAANSDILMSSPGTIQADSLDFVRSVVDVSSGLLPLNVRIKRDERNLVIYRDFDPIEQSSDNIVYGSQISSLEFRMATDRDNNIIPNVIHFRVVTESDPAHHVRFRDDDKVVRAVAEREIFLRHRAMTSAN
ncbi:MAG: hypothetical protein JJU37_12600 [Balneolaceae bacterium]|nr:hypothetical protein [Balneolaceae bacterium]